MGFGPWTTLSAHGPPATRAWPRPAMCPSAPPLESEQKV